jgi:hypothetical protein
MYSSVPCSKFKALECLWGIDANGSVDLKVCWDE